MYHRRIDSLIAHARPCTALKSESEVDVLDGNQNNCAFGWCCSGLCRKCPCADERLNVNNEFHQKDKQVDMAYHRQSHAHPRWKVCKRSCQSVSSLFIASIFFSHVFRGVLFSILAGSNYSSLYSQNEAIFCALFAEVSEAKALMEQIALVCSGRLLLLLRTWCCQTGFTHIGCKVLCTQYVSDILTCWNRLEETGTTVALSFSLPWKHPDMEALLSICAGEHPPLRGARPSTIGSPSFHSLCLQTTSRPWENYSEPKHTKHELICANVGPFRLSPHDEAWWSNFRTWAWYSLVNSMISQVMTRWRASCIWPV